MIVLHTQAYPNHLRDDTNSVAKSVPLTDDFSIPAMHIASARAADTGCGQRRSK